MSTFETLLFLIAALSLSLYITQVIVRVRGERMSSKRIRLAELRVEKEPEKSKPAWDLARVTLESYFNKNLNQVTSIFWLSVFVMLIGFGIIIWGIVLTLQFPEGNLTPMITGMAGIITEVIGATFIFIYRSTMDQAGEYTKTLERINSVGMAMQILDTIPNTAKSDSLKNSTKAKLVEGLMEQSKNDSADLHKEI